MPGTNRGIVWARRPDGTLAITGITEKEYWDLIASVIGLANWPTEVGAVPYKAQLSPELDTGEVWLADGDIFQAQENKLWTMVKLPDDDKSRSLLLSLEPAEFTGTVPDITCNLPSLTVAIGIVVQSLGKVVV